MAIEDEEFLEQVNDDVRRSALDLIEHMVNVHRNYPKIIEDPDLRDNFKINFRIAYSASKRLIYDGLSEKDRNNVDYLGKIEEGF